MSFFKVLYIFEINKHKLRVASYIYLLSVALESGRQLQTDPRLVVQYLHLLQIPDCVDLCAVE